MEKIILYGAGKVCRMLLPLISKASVIIAVIDRNESLHGSDIYGIPVIGINDYLNNYNEYEIIITTNEKFISQIKQQLLHAGINNCCAFYEKFDINELDTRERIISYSMPDQMEDVILYNVFRDEEDIFYIDVGSNDPLADSVTKLLYDKKNARGINVEPQKRLIEITNAERPEDINICMGLGEKDGTVDFYVQGDMLCGISTAASENVNEDFYKGKTTIQITTLRKICDEYVRDREISFLKIDVEGYEGNVLLGADFNRYRPKVIVMEATLPMTDIPCYDKWENILTDNKYHHVFSFGVNRYYVADEHGELDEKFLPILEIMKKYRIFNVR